MIGYLSGRILENAVSEEGALILGVGSVEQGWVGYRVHVPHHPGYELLACNKPIELFIHTHVREDSLDLYGFATRLEKDLFLTLLSVNGIGPKGALGILSKVEPARLIESIVSGEKELLTKIPGIGKKTAERLLLELTEPLKKKLERNPRAGASAPAGATAKDPEASRSQALRDAVSALVGLGFRENDVTSLVTRVLADSSDHKSAPNAEELIKMALRQLA